MHGSHFTNEVTWLARRYKAVAATLIPLLGGVLFLISTGEFDLKHLAGILAVALGSGGITHAVPNVVKGTVHIVTDDVTDTATETVGGVVDGVTGAVGGLLGGLAGKEGG